VRRALIAALSLAALGARDAAGNGRDDPPPRFLGDDRFAPPPLAWCLGDTCATRP